MAGLLADSDDAEEGVRDGGGGKNDSSSLLAAALLAADCATSGVDFLCFLRIVDVLTSISARLCGVCCCAEPL